jgi:8-oxo-dGTP pyrophosphatase MutT (NUDIX family)
MSSETASKPIKDAATVILLRAGEVGVETFMLCRHHRSSFLGGAHVFPGGKVDPQDADPRWLRRIDQSLDDLAARLGEADPQLGLALLVASVRETFEEAGVLMARAASEADLQAGRAELLGGTSFIELADAMDIEIEASALTPYARWITPKMESSRFDTRFFVAVLPEGQRASHDGGETTSATWLRPLEALEQMCRGEIKLAPPTVRTLQWLRTFDDPASVIADALSRKPPLVRPRIVTGNGGWFLALPGDPEHPEDEPVLPGATRMTFDGTAWRDAPSPVR